MPIIGSFIIRKLKEYWRKEWEAKEIQLIGDGEWSVSESSYGKLLNASKKCYMSLAFVMVCL